ncbi:GAF domain-containing protein, partial [bacterium]|nr:GAF domain-containing protein [bacterium]
AAYTLAFALPVAALILRKCLPVSFGERPLLILFMLPIIASSLLGGLGPGLVATATSAVCANYLLIPPVRSFAFAAGHDAVQWAVLIVNGVLVSILSGALRRRQRREAARARDLAAAQTSLRQSEARFRGTLDAMMEGCQIIGFDWRYLYVNEAVVRHARLPRNELLGRTLMEQYPGIEHTALFAALRRCMEQRTPEHMDTEFAYPDGARAWFELSIHPVPEGLFILSIDVTKRKQAETAIALRNAVTAILAQPGTLDETAPRLIEEIAGHTGCEGGELWLVDGKSLRMKRTHYWGPPDERFAEVLEMGASLELARGEGVPGRVWATGQPVWESAIAASLPFPRRNAVLKAGLRSLLCFPVRLGDEVLGAMLFAATEERPPDPAVLELTTVLGSTIGQYITRTRTEEDLRLAHARLRQFVDANVTGIVVASADGAIIEANDYYLNLIGCTRTELVQGKVDWRAVTPPEWLPVDAKALAELRERGTCLPYEKEYIRRDGTRVPVLIVDALLPGPRQEIAAFILDLTERKQAERALRESEEGVRILNKRLKTLQEALARLAAARTLDDVMAATRTAARSLTGADGATFVLRDGGNCFYADEDAIAPLWKGRRFPMETCISGWVMLNRQPAMIEDIYADARIPAEAYRPTFVKSLAMVPIRPSNPLGAIGNYWATPHRPTNDEIDLLRSLADGVAVAMENVQSYQLLEQRVRERTAELEAANEELDAFAYAVSHDLRAPLRHMKGFSQALLEEHASGLSGDARRCLDQIIAASSHMAGLINGLLQLSRTTRGVMRREAVDISAAARRVLSGLEAAEPGRRVAWSVQPGLIARGDPRMLDVVMANLLDNAWKYTAKRADAKIEVGRMASSDSDPATHPPVQSAPASPLVPDAGPDGRHLAVFVRDNGAGFDSKQAHKLFQPFQRLHSESEFPGVGIGLATVQRIVHRHGGAVSAAAAPGCGATFCFTLPLADGSGEDARQDTPQ